MDVFESRLLFIVSHQRPQGRHAHVLVCLVGAKGVPQGMDAHSFADPPFLEARLREMHGGDWDNWTDEDIDEARRQMWRESAARKLDPAV